MVKMILRSSTIIFLIFSFLLASQAKKYVSSEEYKEFQEYKEFEEFKKWKNEKKIYNQLIENDKSQVLDENDQEILLEDFEEKSNKENSSEEKSIEKQKLKDGKRKEDYKNKDYNKRKYYKNEDYERTKKKYEKKIDYEKNKDFDEVDHSFEKITKIQENRDDPPPINEAALMARYIVNQASWTSVATISSRKDIKSFPSANVISFSDGIIGNGSGIPYMYLTPLDFTAQDIFKDNRATLMMTLAQGHYCITKNYDPMDPRCARVILTGKIKPMKNNSAEIEIAEKAVFNRHPWLQHMPANHHFFFAKLKIASIAMLDTFGGPKFVPVKDYLHPPTPNITAEFLRFKLEESNDMSSENLDTNVVNPYIILV